MNFISKLKDWVSPKQRPSRVVKNWKSGMWVMYQDKIAILASLGDLAEIHYTDSHTGENIGKAFVPLEVLRQARYPEIPALRRLISEEAAKELGYGP